MSTTGGDCDKTGKQIRFSYTTERRHAGWFCDRCGDRVSATRKPKRCRFCGWPHTYYIEYRPVHGDAPVQVPR